MASVNIWKKILLQWIKECNFLEVNFYSIDQTEIEQFFIHFKDRFKRDICRYNNLSSFLKEEYPLFEPHFDDENTLSASDHIYVYSLLLHFSCVRYSDPFFQENCKKLDELAQQNITAFFQNLLNDECFTKENLRRVIASIQVFTPPNSRLVFNTDSPIKTPKKMTDISPPTPRSCMLQEKNKKVHTLKAQLDTLEYEKTALETDLKNHKEKIEKLVQELKKSHQEIQDLRNDVLSRTGYESSGDNGPRNSGEEQIRRLNKKIAQKEQEIFKQRETIEDLSEQKESLSEKLKNAEKQMKQIQNEMAELSGKVNDLSQELELKESQIQNLSCVNNELEQYISEIRSSTVNSRPDLNMSAEFLDLSRATNSSGSINSPENLGLVVDIKLREKENENEKLLEEISSIRNDNAKLSKAMGELTERYSKLFDICNQNLISDDDESINDPANYFMIFSNCMQSFAGKYQENCSALNRMQSEKRQIEDHNLSLALKLEEMHTTSCQQNQEIKDLLNTNKLLQTTISSLETKIAELENKLESCCKERSEEANNTKNLQKELATLRIEKLDSEQTFHQQIENLHSCLEDKEIQLQKLLLENQNKSQEIETLTDDQNIKSATILKLESDKESVIDSMQKEIQSLSNNISEYEQKFDRATNQLSELTEKMLNTEGELNSSQQRLQKFSCQLNCTSTVFDKVTTFILHRVTDQLEQETSETNSKISLESCDFDDVEDSNLRDQAKVLIDKIEQVVLDNASLRKKLSEQEHTTKDLNEQKFSLEKNVSQLEADRLKQICITENLIKSEANLRDQITAMTLSIEKLEAEILNKASCAATLLEKQSQAEEFIQKLEEKIIMLETDSKAANEEADKRNQELQNTKVKLDIEIAEKNATREELQKTTEHITLLQSKISSLETEVENTKEQLDIEIAEKNTTKEELQKTTEHITLLQSKISSLETEVENTKEQLDVEIAEKNTTREELQKTTEHNALLQSKISSFETEVQNTKEQLDVEIAEKNTTKEELQNTTEHIALLQSKISSLETQVEGLKKDASKTSGELSQELEKTKIQLDNEASEKQQTREELQGLRLQCENLSTEKMKLSENFENVKLQLQTTEAEKQKMLQLQMEAARKQQEELQSITLQLQTEITNAKNLMDDRKNTKFQLQTEVKNKQQLERDLEETKSRLENEVLIKKLDLEKAQLELQEENKRKSKMSEEFESTKIRLENEVTEKMQIQENLKETKLQLEEKLEQIQELTEERENIKLQLKSRETETCMLEKDLELANKEITSLRSNVTELENKLQESNKLQLENEAVAKKAISEIKDKLTKANNELTELQATISSLETKNVAVNQESEQHNEQLEEIKQKLKKEATEKCRLTEAFENANKQMNELTQQKTILQNEYQVLFTEAEKSRSEVKRLKIEETRLLEDLEALKSKSESEIKKCNKEASEQKENVSRLIQEIASIRKEKQQAEDEKKIISKRLESYLNDHKSIETNQRSVEEKLQLAEKEVLVKLNLLKTEQLKSQDLENQFKKSQLENAKLAETCSSHMKRIEKQALMLGECQAKCQKLKKEADVAQSSLENIKSSTETTQRENSRLSQENKLLKEKLTKFEKSKDQLESTTQTLQREIEKLIDEKKTLETSENNLKTSISSLEKIKHNLEEKIRKLAKSLSDLNVALSRLEQDKVQLNLEVGGLNKQLQEYKTLLAMKMSELEILTSNFIDLKSKNSQLMELNDQHQVQAKEIDEENSRLNDQLSKLSLRLQITQEGHETTKTELEHLRSTIEFSQRERDAIEKDHRAAVERLMGIESLVEERRSSEAEFTNKIKSLETQISKLSNDNFNLEELRSRNKLTIEQLNGEIAMLRGKLEKSEEISQERSSTEVNKIKTLESQISKLSNNVCNLEELRSRDKLTIEQLNEDIKIFTAKLQKSRSVCEENEKKWADERELLAAEGRESEQRIKDTRLELEGKLEKMKNKMKTLYNDEVTKMKKKQERETAVFKTEIDSLKAKNEKHEAHIKKLSSQIFRLNENILEYQKENTFLKTKLNDLENKPRQLSRARSANSAPTPSHQVLSSNLRMEDEEGEIFNNTYLSDLKDGRMSEYFNTDICAQELQYRNSLLPPHLKSTYFAQFDHQMGEDEIRDTPTLDDSSSTLLNTGQRKKVSGATSYKRPGPPTPSKNAGRLSFGGIGELNREILKESIDVASCSSSSSKTPAKFKFFSSKLSMRGDERKSYVANFKRKLLTGSGGGAGSTIQCSSTPRKSKAHIDQRRLLDQIMSNASPGHEFSPDCIVKPAVNLPSSLKKLELNRRMSMFKWRQPQLSFASDSGNSDMNSPQMKEVRYVSSGSKKRSKRFKDRRSSIHLRGGMFARNCRTPTTGFREVFKNKSKVQRNANFNKYRHEVMNEMLVKKASLCPDNWDEVCNNNNNDFFLKELDMHKGSTQDGYSCGEDGEDELNYDNSSKHFQKLLEAKESHAPFEISEINSNPSCYNVNNSSSNVHSRTIYGASVILNRKIPNVSTTMVRKSSIYVKGVNGKSVILVTNQTITLKDLAQMWLQMNVSAKTFIALSLTATLIGITSFLIQFLRQ